MTLDFTSIWPYWRDLMAGVWLTIELSFASTLLGFLLGTLCAIGSGSRHSWVRGLVGAYVETIRNTPLLVQIFIVYFGLATLGLRIDAMVAAIAALVINIGAYTSEIVRAGLEAIHKGQIEAAESLGLSPWRVMLGIVLPPAIEKVYPALTSQFVLLMLATSVTSQISTEELTAVANRIQSETYRSFEIYIVAAVAYMLLSLLMRLGFWALGQILFPRRRRLGTSL
ncbi:amino acid ABC transporter permease [Rhizobacter sp. Root404]|uniref:amino acid ABC transporter permease n=1 Tax=Rhizobacter sp. Root404 TaxID=1736528 RepID=UPI0006FE36DD|nr:amino acid ABC transporter permease [Rhizobacter sp. Root404]KQW38546.1 ABC transporter permease [Rhizobacter sp. Root404]